MPYSRTTMRNLIKQAKQQGSQFDPRTISALYKYDNLLTRWIVEDNLYCANGKIQSCKTDLAPTLLHIVNNAVMGWTRVDTEINTLLTINTANMLLNHFNSIK